MQVRYQLRQRPVAAQRTPAYPAPRPRWGRSPMVAADDRLPRKLSGAPTPRLWELVNIFV